MTREQAKGRKIITLEEWDGGTEQQRREWLNEHALMSKRDIRRMREREEAERRRIAFDMSYEGSREFQEDIGS